MRAAVNYRVNVLQIDKFAILSIYRARFSIVSTGESSAEANKAPIATRVI